MEMSQLIFFQATRPWFPYCSNSILDIKKLRYFKYSSESPKNFA